MNKFACYVLVIICAVILEIWGPGVFSWWGASVVILFSFLTEIIMIKPEDVFK